MPTNRDICAKYSKVIRKLAEKHGETGSGYRVAKDATLARCIGYTMQYIVGGSQVHYRYSKYERGLKSAITKYPINKDIVIHVDIGCGPGLFTWVVVDYLRSNPSIDIKAFGYDRAPNMVKLARLIWRKFDEGEIFFCHHKINKLLRSIKKSKYDNPQLLITFGHILIQTYDDWGALDKFSRIITDLAKLADCRILAVDATMGNRTERFRLACDRLKAAMEKRGLMVDNPHIDNSEMWTVARLGPRE